MDGDDKMPRREALSDRGRNGLRVRVIAAVVVLALVTAGVVVAFRHSSHHLAALHHDITASAGRVSTLNSELATATDQRNRAQHEAALARAALASAMSTHVDSADTLQAKQEDLADARRKAYKSLVDQGARTAQLAALNGCLNGVSQALDLLGVGDVNGWQNTLRSIDGVCRQAQAAIA
ncbi:MAG TPA: hypothetical protein VGI86_12905 [Acidimicrobiia bacterium]|jgi:septal ring factor EnvC (AmiA/AmiB activator)